MVRRFRDTRCGVVRTPEKQKEFIVSRANLGTRIIGGQGVAFGRYTRRYRTAR